MNILKILRRNFYYFLVKNDAEKLPIMLTTATINR